MFNRSFNSCRLVSIFKSTWSVQTHRWMSHRNCALLCYCTQRASRLKSVSTRCLWFTAKLSHINQVPFRAITARWNGIHNSNKTIRSICGPLSNAIQWVNALSSWNYLRWVNIGRFCFCFEPTGTSSFLFTIISFCFFAQYDCFAFFSFSRCNSMKRNNLRGEMFMAKKTEFDLIMHGASKLVSLMNRLQSN